MQTGRTSPAEILGKLPAVAELETEIDRAWRLRLNQKKDLARRSYLRVREHLGLGRVSVVPSATAFAALSEADSGVAIDCVLLGGALARGEGKKEKFLAALSWAEGETERLGLDESFFLLQERGVRSHIEGDYELALMSFQAARLAATCAWQTAVALANALIEMEILGVKAEATLVALEKAVRELPDSEGLPGVEAQLNLFRARHAWHEGRVRNAVDAGLVRTKKIAPSDVDQAFYFSLWLKTLPFTAAFAGAPDDAAIEMLLNAENRVFQKDYLSRTLRHVSHPGDLSSALSYDAVDRIYCWTWRWLTAPGTFPAAGLLATIAALKPFRSDLKLTYDDGEMLRNAFLWLGLFALEPLERMTTRLTAFGGDLTRPTPVFSLERLVIEAAYARRDGNRPALAAAMANVEAHPLRSATEVKLVNLVGLGGGATSDGALAGLVAALGALTDDIDAGKARLIVNVASSSIENRETGELGISMPLARALALLAEKPVVSVEELLARSFGIRSFNPVVHERKIFNLLARAKAVLGDAVPVRVKSGFVVSTGDWSSVKVVNGGTHGRQLAESEVWFELLHGRAEPAGATADGKETVATSGEDGKQLAAGPPIEDELGGASASGAWLPRGAFERLSGRPRSTVNRVLAAAVRDGLIERRGEARATTYSIRKPRELASRLFGP